MSIFSKIRRHEKHRCDVHDCVLKAHWTNKNKLLYYCDEHKIMWEEKLIKTELRNIKALGVSKNMDKSRWKK